MQKKETNQIKKYQDCVLEKIISLKETKSYIAVMKSLEFEDNYLVFSVGDIEATLLTIASNKDIVKLHRPDTFDIYINTLEKLGNEIREILITEKKGTLVTSEIIIYNELENNIVSIDCRPSDAINIALKKDLPIQIKEDILSSYEESISKIYIVDSSVNSGINDIFYNNLPLEQLEKKLQECIKYEEYEEAEKIKKIIHDKKRN